MADRVLPSREQMRYWLNAWNELGLPPGLSGEVYRLVKAHAEHGLVDREAIDYEAAGVKIGEILVGFGRLRPAEVTTKLQGHWAGRVLDAAFGITDDD